MPYQELRGSSGPFSGAERDGVVSSKSWRRRGAGGVVVGVAHGQHPGDGVSLRYRFNVELSEWYAGLEAATA